MQPSASPFSFTCALAGLLIASGVAAPFTPRGDDQVLERLRAAGSLDTETKELRRLQVELAQQPRDPALAARLARLYLKKQRAESDPRYLGYAQGALRPWWDMPQPPTEILVLRATIRQSNHEFDPALNDLEAAVHADPHNALAWLTLATVSQVRGDYDQSRRAALRLAALTDPVVAVTCAAVTASLTGQAESAYRQLSRALESQARVNPEERLWAVTALAEMADRLGRGTEAEHHYRLGLAESPRDAYLLGAYADFLLDHGRAAEAVPLLKDHARVDNLFLRLTLVEREVPRTPKEFRAHLADLRARFEAAHLRGDSVHLREEARFALHLLNEPSDALALALRNWQVQREPADLRILLEAALAARDQAGQRLALDWLIATRLEDARLAKLIARCRALRAVSATPAEEESP